MTEEARLILNELGKINERLDRMDERLDGMDERLDRMDERLDRMDERFDQIEAHLSSSDRKISEIQMTLENEVNKKISIVAEGHCDLVRKLDEALRIENEKEILLIRLTSLEGEITRIKKRLEEIA